jgi:tetratricopeptide (TPR) repeat protein
MRRPRLLFLAVLIVASGSGSAASAFGQSGGSVESREAARTLANRAADAIAHGEYEQGQELLRQAYEQYPAPTIAVLHARALVHLQRLALAENVYERALLTSLAPDAPEAFRRAVEQARSESRELKPRIPRLQVLVRGRAALRLRVTLDGHRLAAEQEGRWMWVDPGRA